MKSNTTFQENGTINVLHKKIFSIKKKNLFLNKIYKQPVNNSSFGKCYSNLENSFWYLFFFSFLAMISRPCLLLGWLLQLIKRKTQTFIPSWKKQSITRTRCGNGKPPRIHQDQSIKSLSSFWPGHSLCKCMTDDFWISFKKK